MRRLCGALVLGWIMSSVGTAVAGRIEVLVLPRDTPGISGATIDLREEGFDLTDVSSGVATFSFADGRSVSGKLEVSIGTPPAGFAPFRMEFLVPFYWDSSSPKRLAAALVKGDVDGNMLKSLIRDGSAFPTQMDNLTVLYQRARQMWIVLHRSHDVRAPNADDIRVVEIFLKAAKELAQQQYYQPDDVVSQAASFLSGLLQDGQFDDRFNSEQRSVSEEILSQLDKSESVQYQAIVNEIKRGIGSSDRNRFKLACERAAALSDFIDGLSPEDRRQIDPNMRREVQNYTNVVICKTRELLEVGKDEPDKVEKIEAARVVSSSMNDRLATYEVSSSVEASVLTDAKKRNAELTTALGALSSQM